MPMAIPLVASAFSISAGLTAGGLLGGMMVAGGALTGLGALTGNKKLLTLGSVLGLAGGVGSALGLGSEAAKTAVTDAAGAAASDAAKATAGNTIADATGTAVGASEAAKAAASTAGDLGAFNSAGGGLVEAARSTPGIAGDLGAVTGISPSDLALQAGTKTANTSAGFWDKLTNGMGANAAGDAMTAVKNTAGTLWDGAKEAVGGVSQWAEKNPNTAKLGAGLVGGAMSYVGQSQAAKDAMAMKLKYEAAIRQRYNDSVAGLQIPSPFSTGRLPSGIIAGSRG